MHCIYLLPKYSILTHSMCHVSLVVKYISVVDVVGPMNPYQPIPFNILSFAIFQSRIIIYAGSNNSTKLVGGIKVATDFKEISSIF